MSKFLAFASSKGGVGKTTLATNFAYLLSEAGENVILIDLNFSSPDVTIHFSGKEYPQTIIDVLNGHVPLNGAVYQHELGPKIIPSSHNFHSELLFPKLHEIMPNLVEHADWIIADFPPRLDGASMNLLSTFDHIVLVTTMDVLSVKRANEMADELKKRTHGKIHFVMNRSVDGHPMKVPEDEALADAMELGRPITFHNPWANSSHAMRKIFLEITGVNPKPPHKTKIMSLLH